MALNSPGTQISVVDESFYTPAAPGTVPLIFVASATNKSNASGTGTAVGTLAANAGKVWTITSQRDLVDTFGTPLFYTDTSGNPIHGGELNEYGLQAAYSLLGVSSKAYIARSDIDLKQLVSQSSVPTGQPVSGTYWVDSNDSLYGISEWDAMNRVFVDKTPVVIDNDNKSIVADLSSGTWIPKASFGVKGSYAITVTSENTNQLWFKNSDNVWVIVGTNYESSFSALGFTSSAWQTSWPVATSAGLGTVSTSTTFSINTVSIAIGATATVDAIATAINTAMAANGVGAKVVNSKLALFADATAKSNGVLADGKITLLDGTTTIVSLGFATAGTTATFGAVTLATQPHTQYPQYAAGVNPTGSVYVKTTSPNKGASWLVKYFNGATQTWGTVPAPIYSSTSAAIAALDAAGGKNISAGSLFVEVNYDQGTGASTSSVKLAEFKVLRRVTTAATTITGTANTSTIATTSTFQIAETIAGSPTYSAAATVTIPAGSTVADVATAISATGLTNISASYSTAANTISISHSTGGDFKLLNVVGTPLTVLGFAPYNISTGAGTPNLYATGLYDTGFTLRASNWKPLVYEAKQNAPYTTPSDGTLWYSSVVDQVDIMYHNGSTWVGYKTAFPSCNASGPIVSSLAPTTQSDGSTSLVNGDIWISTSNVEQYGQNVYVFNGLTLKWVKQDVGDQTSPTGWLFADARLATSGAATEASTIVDLLSSNYLDPDAPDPALYPQGMRLWNLRRSGFNVKKYVKNYINIYANNGQNTRFGNDPMDGSNSTTPYFADRWVTASPNNNDGSGTFGRFAQRGFIVAGIKALIDTSQAVRDTDTLVFNLIATPGYTEAIQNMVALNADRKLTAFIVGDTPFRLTPTGTALAEWGNNTNLAFDNSDVGAVSYDTSMAMFYPSGFTNDNTGNFIVVPPSHMMLRTIANSDAKSYQWFAPAGTRRGNVDNATSVGYVQDGEFKTVSLHESLRDVLAGVKINPIATLPGVGIVNFGNYTRSANSSSLDRINAARLVCYLRRQLDILSKPFLFEPNDRITRNEFKAAVDSLLLELVSQRAINDFLVVCDESNNTNARIDRSELWCDTAIEITKGVEFIFLPLRLKNTGDIKAGL